MASGSSFGVIVAALLRCGSCRYAALYFLSFYGALVAGQRASWRWVAFGSALWFLHSFGTELVNRLSDRVEDRINRPVRTALCHVVGYDRIRTLSLIVWLTVAAIDLVWLWRRPNIVLAILLCLGLLAGVQYSYGLRFKRRTYFSNFALTWPFGGPFLIGWAGVSAPDNVIAALQDLIVRLGPFLLIVGTFIGTLAGIKDVPDTRGDEQVGYQSFWVSLIRRNASWSILGLISSPFVQIIGLVWLGLLPPRFAALLLFFPISVVFALAVRRGEDDDERQATRELFYQYWFAFVALALWLYLPVRAMGWGILGTTAYWVVTSQRMHWSDGIRLWKVQKLVELVARRRVVATVPL